MKTRHKYNGVVVVVKQRIWVLHIWVGICTHLPFSLKKTFGSGVERSGALGSGEEGYSTDAGQSITHFCTSVQTSEVIFPPQWLAPKNACSN